MMKDQIIVWRGLKNLSFSPPLWWRKTTQHSKENPPSAAMKSLTVAALEKEEQRIAAFRVRSEARRDRFLNSRVRSIGVDLPALEKQVAEKQAAAEADRNADAGQVEREQYINMLIERREMEEKELKKAEIDKLKGAWSEHKLLPKNEAPKRSDPVVLEECGISSIQRFNGEDMSVYDRSRLQQNQMKAWSAQQIAERQAAAEEEVKEGRRYAAYLKMVADRREELEGDEDSQARILKLANRNENQVLIAQKKIQMEEVAKEEAESKLADIQAHMNSPFLCEDTTQSYNVEGRIRRDMFKGLSRDQILQFYVENEAMVDAKIKASQEDKDADWKAHISSINKIIDHADSEAKAGIKEVTAEHRRQLKQQAIEAQERKAASKNDRFGSIDNGFFDGFGCSVR